MNTKLSAPQRRIELVSRPHLLNLLDEGSTGSLTLICAPPGYGKTTLLTEWIASRQKEEVGDWPIFCWLSLDERDNDPDLFLRYLVHAFENGKTLLSREARGILEVFPLPPFQTVLTVLINELNDITRPIFLVLDDYQFISNQHIHEELAYFLDRKPVNLHVLIATRSDPPLPLARLRARNQLVEIRADDLRFTAEEAGDFLTKVMHLPLSPVDVSALETRTEGWIAGLQMAAVAMRGLVRQGSLSTPGVFSQERANFSQFIELFSGSHRYILDYMAVETIQHLPEAVQRFLACTSLLERFCAPLCDAVLDDPTVSSEAMLEYLDRANLFLIALDIDPNSGTRECWYRYHHLFRDLLQARLRQTQPDSIHPIHLRAAEWYEQNGFTVEAVQHCLSVKDNERAAGLIERYGPARWSQSDTGIMLLARFIPQETLINHPKLGIYRAWILIASGQTPAAVSLLHPLREHVCNVLQLPSSSWISVYIDILLSYTSDPADPPDQQPLPEFKALETMPEEDLGLHNIGDFLYAMLLARRGELDTPTQILTRCVDRDVAAGGTTAISLAIPFLARARLLQGRLHEAAELCREYLKPVTKRGAKYFYTAGSLNIILGEALREWNELDEAEAQIRAGITINEPWNNIASDSLGYAALARVQEARGDVDSALATLQTLDAMFEGRSRPLDWVGEQRSLQIRLWLATGELARAVDWVNHFSIQPSPNPLQETDYLTVARVRLAERNYQEAIRVLAVLDQSPGIEKRVNRKLKINLLMARALAGLNQLPQAFQMLEESLRIAEPEGLVRVFLDNGEPVKELLKLYLVQRAPDYQAFIQKLLAEYSRRWQVPGSQAATVDTMPPGLAEPLTPRELDVLKQMGAGCTNRQIAEILVLAEGTIKFHVHSILEKLGVHSRTAALVRAKELRLI